MEGDHNWGKVYGVKIAENGRGVIESGRVVYESGRSQNCQNIDVNFWSAFRYCLKMVDPTFPRTIRNPPRWTGVQLLFQCSTLGRLFNKFDNRQVPLGC